MWATLLKLVPFRDYAYVGIAIAAAVFWWHHDQVEQAAGAAKEVSAVQAATAKAEAAADALFQKNSSEYANSVLAMKDAYEKRIADANTAHDADVKRLQQLAASRNRGSNKAVPSASSSAASSDAGNQGFSGLGIVPAGLGLELADALRQDDAALTACWAERDSLTGK
jgi:hypothetical protein